VLSDHIAKNNGVGWPELGASHKKEMLCDLCGINRQACGKLTQLSPDRSKTLPPELLT
jgi:hypothetical protein